MGQPLEKTQALILIPYQSITLTDIKEIFTIDVTRDKITTTPINQKKDGEEKRLTLPGSPRASRRLPGCLR